MAISKPHYATSEAVIFGHEDGIRAVAERRLSFSIQCNPLITISSKPGNAILITEYRCMWTRNMIVFSLETVETGRYKQHIVIPGIVKRVSHCNSRAEFAPNANGAFLSNTCADCVIKLWFTLVLGAAAARWRPLLKRLYCRLSTMVAEK